MENNSKNGAITDSDHILTLNVNAQAFGKLFVTEVMTVVQARLGYHGTSSTVVHNSSTDLLRLIGLSKEEAYEATSRFWDQGYEILSRFQGLERGKKESLLRKEIEEALFKVLSERDILKK